MTNMCSVCSSSFHILIIHNIRYYNIRYFVYREFVCEQKLLCICNTYTYIERRCKHNIFVCSLSTAYCDNINLY